MIDDSDEGPDTRPASFPQTARCGRKGCSYQNDRVLISVTLKIPDLERVRMGERISKGLELAAFAGRTPARLLHVAFAATAAGN